MRPSSNNFKGLAPLLIAGLWVGALLSALLLDVPWSSHVIGFLGFPVALLVRYLLTSRYWTSDE
jgi:hypothetical protein